MLFAFSSGAAGFGSSCSSYERSWSVSAVSSALACCSEVDASRIEVSLKDGDIILTGEASSRREIERAEEIARSVGGHGVHNRIWLSHAVAYSLSSDRF